MCDFIEQNLTGGRSSTIVDGYDAGGRKVSQTRDAGTTLYTYDSINRLTGQSLSGANATYTYDNIGNQTLKWQQGNSPMTMSYDVASRLTTLVQGTNTTSYGYDHNGNTTSETIPGSAASYVYGYDYRNRLAAVEVITGGSSTILETATYDGDGLRRSREAITGTTCTYSKGGELLEMSHTVETTTFIWDGADYSAEVSGGSIDVVYGVVNGQLMEENRGGTVTEYVPDTLGSVIQTTDASGSQTSSAFFWPFGETRTTSGTNPSPWNFVGTYGYYLDSASGSPRYYIRARSYRPDLSRWLTVDSYWPFEDGYTYADWAPVTSKDPSGNGCLPCAIQLYLAWKNSPAHRSNNVLWHQYVHCMSCCILANLFGKGCAYAEQRHQIFFTEHLHGIKSDTYRRLSCDFGVHVGLSNGGTVVPYRDLQEKCKAGCAEAGVYPISSFWPPTKRLGNPITMPVGAPGPGNPPPPLPEYPPSCNPSPRCSLLPVLLPIIDFP